MAEPYRQPASRLTPNGAAGPSVQRENHELAPLLAEPERFGLFAALRLIEAAHPDRPRLGEARRACDEPVRLGQPPHLHFPPAAIAGFEAARGGRPARLRTYAFGLFGPQGPLPLHLSREALARVRHRSDPALAEFCDVLHHRLLSLYWRAYAGARPAVEQDRPGAGRFRHRLGAVAGLAGPGFADRSALPDGFSLHAAGLLALQSRPAEALTRLVSLYFSVPAGVREFVGAWLDIPPGARTYLGGLGSATPRLGRDTVVGTRVHLREHRFRLILGPLSLPDFLRFLPDGEAWEPLRAITRRVPGPEFDWDLQLVLRREEVPATVLSAGTGGVRLGWTSWIATRRRERDADDVVLLGSG
ncbi:type VI secretion system baseplate subunit TssG [Belnapia sp. T6]|uniref:Type VI secretion system baseplate subunit TssG n=1 Tax=Belnapia mucosa TaxID=2804532 RepID=A0ABS1VAG9_9PROT|nr:type VI secretion system baseplate subunit TssG [Belnapia mucosa]MBL6458653.1 type VI secretion system baseplate subunit TssG [Belnapia mucosa]